MIPGAPDEPGADEFTALDWIGVISAAGAVTALLIVPLWFAPRFVEMFEEFGAELPKVTQLVLTPWASPIAAAACAGVLFAGVFSKLRMGVRRGLIGLSFLLACIGVVAFVGGLYLPLIRMAGAIK